MGAVSYDIATDSQGRSSIDANVWLADILVPKPILYDAIRNGTFNGNFFNIKNFTYVIKEFHTIGTLILLTLLDVLLILCLPLNVPQLPLLPLLPA